MSRRPIEKNKIREVIRLPLSKQAGVHIVSDVMGHEKLETTKRFYVHAKEQTMTESVIKLTLGTPRQNPSVPRSVPQNKKTAKTA